MALATKNSQIKEFLIYCGCGLVSAAVDAGVYFTLVNLTLIPAPICVLMGTISATIVSFLLMKPFVFRSKNWSKEVLWPEIVRFVTTRIAAILFEVLFSLVTVSILGWNENSMRIIGWIVIAVGNYLCAKFVVFKYRTYR